MTRDEAKAEICKNWRDILQRMSGTAKKRVNGESSYICPLCGNGQGSNGDGITRNPRSSKDGLKCFKCGFSGDIIALYQTHIGADYNTALSLLAQEIGIEIDKPDRAHHGSRAEGKAAESPQGSFDQSNDKKGNQAQKPAESATQEHTEGSADYTAYYKQCRERLESPEAVSYLSARGISVKTAARCWIGYDPKADPAKAPGGIGEIKYPCPRLIIPTSKSHYVGRSVKTDTPPQYEKSNAKGSSPDIFNKNALYAEEVKRVFVTEGAFDALSVIEALSVIGALPDVSAVAINSTSNAEMFIKQIEKSRPAARLIISLDNDSSGEAATETIIKGLQRLDVPYEVCKICGTYKDQNEHLQKDREGFMQAVKDAVEQADKWQQPESEQQAADQQDDIDKFLQKIQGDTYRAHPTGIKDIDNRLGGGLIKQWLVLIGAAPGAGKTAFACQIMENYARQGQECVYINLEMSKEQLLARSISRIAFQSEKAKISALQVLRGYEHTEQQRGIVNRAATIYKNEILPAMKYVDDTGANIDSIFENIEKRAVEAEKAGKPAPFVCLDYLQLVTGGEREDVVSTLKRAVVGLKKYALKHNSIVICIIAQNREANNSSKASMSAGRDTSNLEYTCDLQIQMIKNKDQKVIDFFVTKSRFTEANLKTPTPLLFEKGHSLFLLMEKSEGYRSSSLYDSDDEDDEELELLRRNNPFEKEKELPFIPKNKKKMENT